MRAAPTGIFPDMSENRISKLGFSFTPRTVKVMRDYLRVSKIKGCEIISYVVNVYSDGILRASLGADFTPQHNAIKDVISGIVFYWYADKRTLSMIRPLVIDTSPDMGTNLINPETPTDIRNF